MSEYSRIRTVDEKNIANDKKQTHLGGTHFPLGDLEDAERVSSQIRIDRQHQENDQHRSGNSFGHVTGKSQPENQKHGAKGIYDVVHIEAVTRPLPVSVSREGSIQTIAKPVEKYEE